MNFYYKHIFKRVTGLISSPVSGWKAMKSESGYLPETFSLLFVCCALAGSASLIRNMHWASETFVLFFTMVISSVSARFLSPKVRNNNWEGTLNLIVYSSVPALICYSLSLLIGYRLWLLPPGLLYSVGLLSVGISVFTGAKSFNTVKLTVGFICVIFTAGYVSLVLLSV